MKIKMNRVFRIFGRTYSIIDAMAVLILSIIYAVLVITNVPIDELLVVAMAIIIVLVQIDSKYLFILALFGLVCIPILLATIYTSLAETLAVYVFYALTIGLILVLLEEQSFWSVLNISKTHKTGIKQAYPQGKYITKLMTTKGIAIRPHDNIRPGNTAMWVNANGNYVYGSQKANYRQTTSIQPRLATNQIVTTHKISPKSIDGIKHYHKKA